MSSINATVPDDAGVGCPALNGDRLDAGSGWWTSLAVSEEFAGLVVAQRIRAGPQQFAGLGVGGH